MAYLLLLMILLILRSFSFSTMIPIYQPTADLQADFVTVASVPLGVSIATKSSILASTTLPFPMAFPAVPQAIIGLSQYRSNINTSAIFYKFYVQSTTKTKVTIKVQMNTQVWALQVRYIALSGSFPYHFNLLNNVQIASDLSIDTPTTITKSVNYASLTAACKYKLFNSSFSNYHIVFYLSCYQYSPTTPSNSPTILRIQSFAITNISYFSVTMFLGTKVKYNYLHCNIMVYDKQQIRNSGAYNLTYVRDDFAPLGGVEYIRMDYWKCAMMGWTDYETANQAYTPYFTLNLVNDGDIQGMKMPQQQPRGGQTSMNRYGISLFIMGQIRCINSSYYYNLTTQMCTECVIIPGCLTCTSISNCTQCDQSGGYFKNAVNLCQACSATVPNCAICSSFGVCQKCDESNGYFRNVSDNKCYLCPSTIVNCLVCSSFGVCSQCDEANGYFKDSPTSTQCTACSDTSAHCLNCSAYGICNLCKQANGYFLNPNDFKCYSCSVTIDRCSVCNSFAECRDCTLPYVRNYSDASFGGQCVLCPIVGCALCSHSGACIDCDQSQSYGMLPNSQCQLCNATAEEFINMTSQICQICSIPHCINCETLYKCKLCNDNESYFNTSMGECVYCNSTQNFFINITDFYECELCMLNQCIICSSLTLCSLCNISSNYVLNLTTNLCQPCPIDNCIQCEDINHCQACNQSNLYFLNSDNTLCIMFQSSFIAIQKQGCNGFVIKIMVYIDDFATIKDGIRILNKGVAIKSISVPTPQKIILIHAQYKQSLVNTQIFLQIQVGYVMTIIYDPSTPPLYYSQAQCQGQQKIKNAVLASEIVSYGVLLVSLLSCKIVGLELFGVMQLAYFTLSSHSFLNLYLAPLTKLKLMNGLNIGITNERIQLPQTLQTMGMQASFINNCNIMILLLFGQIFVTGIVYLFAKLTHQRNMQIYSIVF